MTAFTVHASGPAPADEVWERYARPGLWPSWSPQTRRVEVGVDRLTAGIRGRVIGPAGVSVDFVVDSWDDPGRRWSWTVRPRTPRGLPSLRLRLEHGVTELSDSTETWLRVEGPLPAVLAYLPPARLALSRFVR